MNSEIHESAMDIASSAGAPELGPRVGNGFRKSKSELYALGTYLQEIRASLPEMLQGKTTTYNSTVFYKTNAPLWSWMTSSSTPAEEPASRLAGAR